MEKMKKSCRVDKKPDANIFSSVYLDYHSYLRKNIEVSSEDKVNKKLRRIDKIFNFLEEFTMISPFVGVITTTILYKINELHGAYTAYAYISNLVGIFLLPLSILNLKKSRQKFKDRILKNYKREH